MATCQATKPLVSYSQSTVEGSPEQKPLQVILKTHALLFPIFLDNISNLINNYDGFVFTEAQSAQASS